MFRFLISISLAWAALLGSSHAQTPKPAPATPEWVNAEVVKIDAPRNRITLKHERIASIKMDAMTMPFKVKDKALLDGRKSGDKLQVVVQELDGDLFVTHMRALP
jgi:Cu/Ag efflux protein CusF